MERIFDRDLGESFCNTVRQIAFTKIPVIRPIGFSFGNSTTIVSTGGITLEDSVAVSNALSNLVFKVPATEVFTRQEDPVFACSYQLKRNQIFTDRDLVAPSVEVFKTTGAPLFHLQDFSEITFTVYFAFCGGRYTSEENRVKILEKFPSCGPVVCMASKHCNVSDFSINMVRRDYKNEVVQVSVKTNDGTLEADLWKQCLGILDDLVVQFN